jgi:hypothetical protein
MIASVQVVEMTTTTVAGLDELMDQWMTAAKGRRNAHRSVLTRDRERVGGPAPHPAGRAGRPDIGRIGQVRPA